MPAEPETYYPKGKQPAYATDGSIVVGTKCVQCGKMLTADNIGAVTDRVGVCNTCRPPSAPHPPPAG